MSVVFLAPLLETRRVQRRAVRHDHVVAAVGRLVPDRLVLAHEDYGDARGEAAERRRGDGFGRGFDGGERWVWFDGGDVVPDPGVG